MEFALPVLSAVISIVSIICYVMIMVAAFKERLLYGFMCMFCCGLGGLIYGIMRWDQLKKPFLGWLMCNMAGFCIQFYTVKSDLSGSGLAKFLMEQNPQSKQSVVEPETEPRAAGPSAGQSYPARQIGRAAAVAEQASARSSEAGEIMAPAQPAPGAETSSDDSAGFDGAAGMTAGEVIVRPAAGSAANLPEVVVKGEMDEGWRAACELLKVSGVMKTSNSAVAIVNKMTVGLNEEASVSMDGQVFRFKITGIDVNAKKVEFIPVSR